MNIPLNIDFLQILLHMLNFVILAGGLSLLLFNPVVKFMDERRRRYEDEAEKNRAEAERLAGLREAYEKKLSDAESEIDEMKKNAQKEWTETSERYIRESKAKASEIILAAEREAEVRKEHILESAQTEIGELVLAATQKLLSDTVTPERNSALYDEFIRVAGSKSDKTK